MKSVLVNGAKLEMDARVAGVLVEYALALADRGVHASVTVPMRVDGAATTGTLSLGSPAVWIVLDGVDEPVELPGSDDAADELEARLMHLLQRSSGAATPSPLDSALDWLDFA